MFILQFALVISAGHLFEAMQWDKNTQNETETTHEAKTTTTSEWVFVWNSTQNIFIIVDKQPFFVRSKQLLTDNLHCTYPKQIKCLQEPYGFNVKANLREYNKRGREYIVCD